MENSEILNFALKLSMLKGLQYNRILTVLRSNNYNIIKTHDIIKKKYPSIIWPSAFTISSNIASIHNKKISTITIDSPMYPGSLKQTDSPPIIIYYIGNVNLFKQLNKSISIVGSRLPTKYGQRVAMQLSKELSEQGYTIVSGMASGIDRIAHLSSISNTIAVLGCGVDNIYPYSNSDLYNSIIKNNSLLISEFPISSPPTAYNFPKRNRIIAALTKATLIIEAKIKSGSLITARIASSYNKDVFAIPGSIGKDESSGCNFLIKHNIAQLVENVDDIINYMETFVESDMFSQNEMFIEKQTQINDDQSTDDINSNLLKQSTASKIENLITDKQDRVVFDAIEIKPLTIEQIFKKTNLNDIKKARISIINLQLMNLIDIDPEGKYFLNQD